MIDHLIQKQDVEDRKQILLMASDVEPSSPTPKADGEELSYFARKSFSTMP